MPYESFNALNEQLITLFQSGSYAEALELARQEEANFPLDRALIVYWQLCAAARNGDPALVYQIAEQRLAEGVWYGESMWRNTPSFKGLQGEAEFERIVATSSEIAQRHSESLLIVAPPKEHTNATPLLLALHGNQSSASETVPFWRAAIRAGWLTVLPQSRQVAYHGAYIWDDLAASFSEVQAHLAKLGETTPFDRQSVVIGGHSMGGLIAIHMAVSGMLDVCGFVVNGPAVPFWEVPAELAVLLSAARERGVRGYFIIGENDTAISADNVIELAQTLQSAGIACRYEMVAGATHDYSPDYDAALLRGLAFVTNTQHDKQ